MIAKLKIPIEPKILLTNSLSISTPQIAKRDRTTKMINILTIIYIDNFRNLT